MAGLKVQNQDVREFWLEKEKQNQSKLVIASVATYIQGYPQLPGPVNGLFYLMENGVYFENFEKKNMWSSLVPQSKPFKKIYLQIPINSIEDLQLAGGKPEESHLLKRFIRFFSTRSRRLIINFRFEKNQLISAEFEFIGNVKNIFDACVTLIKSRQNRVCRPVR